jgi:hypothetical protein
LEKYLYSLHWIIQTFTTVGYGETPITWVYFYWAITLFINFILFLYWMEVTTQDHFRKKHDSDPYDCWSDPVLLPGECH